MQVVGAKNEFHGDVLAVRAILVSPDMWTQGHAARDQTGLNHLFAWIGNSVEPEDARARCFCLYGAMHRGLPPMKPLLTYEEKIKFAPGNVEKMSKDIDVYNHAITVRKDKIEKLFKDIINTDFGSGYIDIISWNDDPERTWEDIDRLLNIAVEKAEAIAA